MKYTANYTIAVYSHNDNELLCKTTGVRHESTIPLKLLDQLGQRYGDCLVVYTNITEGWIAEKDFD